MRGGRPGEEAGSRPGAAWTHGGPARGHTWRAIENWIGALESQRFSPSNGTGLENVGGTSGKREPREYEQTAAGYAPP